MHYTVRAFARGDDERLDGMCRVFPSMERSAYNLLRDGARGTTTKQLLRERYGMKNARWLQSAINQADAVMKSQEDGIRYGVELYEEKIRNTMEKMERLHNPIKISGCEVKIEKLRKRVRKLKERLNDKSYSRAVFGSKDLLHRLSIAKGQRREELKKEWRVRRSNHFFSVGQANQRGNGNTRLSYDGGFHLEIRNWFHEDFRVNLEVPEYAREILKRVIERAASVKLEENCEILYAGLAYSVRAVRCVKGYQMLVSFELDEPIREWNGRMAGIDINPEGIACTVVAKDGNLVATRFFRDNRLITASKNKRKWMLEDVINRMLKWCLCSYGCNAVAIERLSLKGAYDHAPSMNFKLSNFMRRKMLDVIGLHALKMKMLCVNVNPAYSSMVATAKYGKQFGGFNRHQLAAFVIARRALGYGETPVMGCLPTKKERKMWSHCIRYYGYQPQLQTMLRHEPMERKSGRDGNGGRVITELFKARPTITSAMGLGYHTPVNDSIGIVDASEISEGRVGSVHPNRQTIGGDGATGHRVNPADDVRPSAVIFHDKEDNVFR